MSHHVTTHKCFIVHHFRWLHSGRGSKWSGVEKFGTLQKYSCGQVYCKVHDVASSANSFASIHDDMLTDTVRFILVYLTAPSDVENSLIHHWDQRRKSCQRMCRNWKCTLQYALEGRFKCRNGSSISRYYQNVLRWCSIKSNIQTLPEEKKPVRYRKKSLPTVFIHILVSICQTEQYDLPKRERW